MPKENKIALGVFLTFFVLIVSFTIWAVATDTDVFGVRSPEANLVPIPPGYTFVYRSEYGTYSAPRNTMYCRHIETGQYFECGIGLFDRQPVVGGEVTVPPNSYLAAVTQYGRPDVPYTTFYFVDNTTGQVTAHSTHVGATDFEVQIPAGYEFFGASTWGNGFYVGPLTLYLRDPQGAIYSYQDGKFGQEIIPPSGFTLAAITSYGATHHEVTSYYCKDQNSTLYQCQPTFK